jgi:hypothetical protein
MPIDDTWVKRLLESQGIFKEFFLINTDQKSVTITFYMLFLVQNPDLTFRHVCVDTDITLTYYFYPNTASNSTDEVRHLYYT